MHQAPSQGVVRGRGRAPCDSAEPTQALRHGGELETSPLFSKPFANMGWRLGNRVKRIGSLGRGLLNEWKFSEASMKCLLPTNKCLGSRFGQAGLKGGGNEKYF